MKVVSLIKFSAAISVLVFSGQAFSADFSISAIAGCKVMLGTGTDAGDYGVRNDTTGSIVIGCSIAKASTTNFTKIWARQRNAVAGGAQAFCNATASSSTGGQAPISGNTSWASTAVGGSEITVALPSSQYNNGYMNVICIVPPGDSFYGLRYQY